MKVKMKSQLARPGIMPVAPGGEYHPESEFEFWQLLDGGYAERIAGPHEKSDAVKARFEEEAKARLEILRQGGQDGAQAEAAREDRQAQALAAAVAEAVEKAITRALEAAGRARPR